MLHLLDNKVVIGRTINDAWRDILWCCVRKGYPYTVKEGSYVGQMRLQLDRVMVEIEEPNTRPLSVYIPEGLPFPAPTSEGAIHDYFFAVALNL